MSNHLKKRALIPTGAGGSIEFGAPSTTGLTNIIERKILTDSWMRHCGVDQARLSIRP